MVSWMLVAVLAGSGEVRAKPVPAAGGAPVVDGKLKEYGGAAVVKPIGTVPGDPNFVARVAWKKDTIYVGVELTQLSTEMAEQLQLSLFFPGAGTTARGHVHRFGLEGKLPAPEGAVVYADAQVKAATEKTAKGYNVEVGIPAAALPRFHATEPLELELCVTVGRVSSCHGMTPLEPLKLPDEFRKGLKLGQPERVLALESVPAGWVGFAELYRPFWLSGSKPVTREMLAGLFDRTVEDPAAIGVNIPTSLAVEGFPLVGVVTGQNPYEAKGKCNGDVELRVSLYKVDGKQAHRVLDWPVATCQLGRATAVEMEKDTLSIGYSNGPVTQFTWTVDHFERTELGNR
ncbi:MAG: hypothetical protein FJ086_10550 [Deltaproteobacteria bacterium]|nr:hypothetical protein [Deltaproteobacteria bacterium]